MWSIANPDPARFGAPVRLAWKSCAPWRSHDRPSVLPTAGWRLCRLPDANQATVPCELFGPPGRRRHGRAGLQRGARDIERPEALTMRAKLDELRRESCR